MKGNSMASVTLRLRLVVSSFLVVIVMVAGEDLHIDPVKAARETIVSNSETVAAYWHTVLPNAPMPLAILELLATPNEKGIEETYIKSSYLKARKIGLHSSKEANTKRGKVLHSKGSSTETDDETTANFPFGPATNDQNSAYFRWGPATNDQRSAYFRWGPATNDQRSAYFRWGAPATNDQRSAYFRWGPATNDKKSAYFRWGQESMENVQGQEGRNDGDKHMPDDFMVNNTIFLEEALTPGSTITAYIRPSAIPGGAPLLRRHVADSIPMSTENFTDIMAMFAPASHGMARDIWSTLDICEHLRPVKGEKKTCITSVESMVEFAASVVAKGNTHDLRAFSSRDVPAEGVTSRKRYKVTAARKITEEGDTVTCHNMKFPVAAYMCHAVNPTRVYTVKLESLDVVGAGEAEQRMEALAVCHLDTSEFGAMNMPEHIKPGDAPLCHFISRDSFLWAAALPAATA